MSTSCIYYFEEKSRNLKGGRLAQQLRKCLRHPHPLSGRVSGLSPGSTSDFHFTANARLLKQQVMAQLVVSLPSVWKPRLSSRILALAWHIPGVGISEEKSEDLCLSICLLYL